MIAGVFEREARFDTLLLQYRLAADKVMLSMCLFLSAICFAIAPLNHALPAAVLIGGGTLIIAAWLYRRAPGTLLVRVFMACAFMAYTGLIIHETNGSIEGHFSAFGLIGILLYYRDWRVILAATIFIYLHHLILGLMQTMGYAVYVFDTSAFWAKFLEHVLYFLPFVSLLGYLAQNFRREAYETERVIHLAKAVAEGEFSAEPEQEEEVEDDASGLLASVTRMRNSIYSLLKNLPVAAVILRTEDQMVLDANEAFRRMFGIELDQIRKKPIDGLPIWESGTEVKRLICSFDAKGGYTTELGMTNSAGSSIQISLNGVVQHSETTPFLILTFDDVTLRRQSEERMRELAFFDWLTGISNRAAFHENLQRLLDTGAAEKAVGLMLIDLDNFKPVNDLHGHDAGDVVLKVIASRIKATIEGSDMAARLGGDEFVVLLRACPDAKHAGKVADNILEAIQEPIEINEHVVCRVGATIGVCWYEGKDLPPTVEQLLAEADMALYNGKKLGKNRVAAFTAQWAQHISGTC